MKKKLYYAFWFIFFGQILPAAAQTVPETIDELLKAFSSQNAFNGVALVAQHGKVIWLKGYGYRNLDTKTRNDSGSVFQVGSLSKQFTAVVILQLAESHKLDLQDRLSKYIPSFPQGDDITIENLLTHMSGISDYTHDSAFIRRGWVMPIPTDSLIEFFKDKPFEFKPGKGFAFSNSGYILLGYIIEKVTGESYFQVVREHIFQPLHMNHSGFDFKGLHAANKALGYYGQSGLIADSSVLFSSEGIFSTAADLFAWDQGLYTGKLLSDTSLQKAFTPHRSNYGFGWIIDSSSGSKVEMHEGVVLDYASFMARLPQDQICIILLDNHQSQALVRIAQDINAVLNNQPYEWPVVRTEIKVDPLILAHYTGRYQLIAGFVIQISLEHGSLVAVATGQGKVELFAEKENLFFTKIMDSQFEFLSDEDGHINRLVLHQNGGQFTCFKMR
jgi:CubicO group peptidase (beta-lactamase class C family)